MRIRLSLFLLVACLCTTPSAQALKQPLGPEFNISTPSTASAGAVSVAADSDTGRYLVVMAADALRGRVIDRDGTPLTDELVLADTNWSSRGLDVAYNAALHEYLIIYSGYVSIPWLSGAVFAQRSSASGAKIGGVINVGLADPNTMSVACSSRSGTCLVAWSGFGVHARFIGPGGNPVTPEIELAPSGGQIRRATQTGPSVAYAPAVDRYLVVWGDLGAVSGAVFDGGGGSVGGCCFIPRGSSPLVAYNAHDRQFGVLFTTAPEGAYSAYYVAGARVLENGDHSVDGIVAPGTTYGASFASDSHEGTYLAAWPGSNGGDGEASFLAANLTPIAPAHFAAGYVVTYNPAADEYLLVRSSCIQPGGLLAVCGRRVGNPPAAADRTGPALRLSVRRLQRIVRQRGLVLRARCDEACVVRASARVGVTALKLHPDKKSLTPGAAKKLKLKATKEILRTLRHVLRHRNRLKVRLKVTATDFAGNRTIAKRKLRARR